MTKVLFDYNEGKVSVLFPFNMEVINIIKTLDIRTFDWNKKIWYVGLTEVETLKERLEINKHIVNFSISYTQAFLTDKPEVMIWTPIHHRIKMDYPYLFSYQIEDVAKLLTRNEYLVAHEMGTGKTVIALTYLKEISKSNPSFKGLIIVPVSLIRTWLDENEKFTKLPIQVIRGTKKQREEQWKVDSPFYITNYETVRGLKEHSNWDIIIADEVSRIKNNFSKTHQAMSKVPAKKRIGLSGNPIENTVKDLYSIVNWIEPTILPKFSKFRELFLVEEFISLPDGREFRKLTGYKNLPLLKKMVAPVFMRREKKEVIKDLPELFRQTITVDLNSEEKWLYNEYLNEAEELLEEGHSSIGVGVKIREMLSGLEAKIEECVNICKETNGKIIVFGEYHQGLNKLQAKLFSEGIKNEIISGEVPMEQREKILDYFRNSDLKVLILQTKVGGYGLNLQEASTVCFLNRPWTIAAEDQAISRSHRTGQKSNVIVYYLISDTDFENRVNEILEEKKMVTDAVVMNDILKKRKGQTTKV